MTQLKLRVLQGERFSCQQCTDCCRDRLIPLSEKESSEISQLDWPDGHRMVGKSVVRQVKGNAYLRQKPNGACIFLNEDNNLCHLHETFFKDRKPLVCRTFPFRVFGTFEDEISVTGSYECPTVRKNEGKELAARNQEFIKIGETLNATEGVHNKKWFAGLTPREVANVVGFVATHLSIFETVEEEALFIYFVCEHVEKEPSERPTKEYLNLLLPTLQEEIEEALASRERKGGNTLPKFRQMAFRSLMAMYLRNEDEEIDGRVKKLDRRLDSFMITWGAGNFASLGALHPKGSLAKAKLFSGQPWQIEELENNLLKRMVRTRLLSRQFMGKANYGANFFNGLRSIALAYPMVMALAKYRAGNRKEKLTIERDIRDAEYMREQEERAARVGVVPVTTSAKGRTEARKKRQLKQLRVLDEDVNYGVRVVDRAIGQSHYLRTRRARIYNYMLTNKQSFTQLILSV